MGRKFTFLTTLLSVLVSFNVAKEPALPLCPTNIQYLPQKLPMHCRMPTAAEKATSNVMPMPMPGMSMGMPGGPAPMGLPGPGQVPLQMGMPMGFPYAMPPPAPKLPVIVMPFYSPDKSFKHSLTTKRPKHNRETSSDDESSDTDTDGDTDTSSGSDDGFWKKRRRHSRKRGGRKHTRRNNKEEGEHGRRGDVLTPVLQYMTKDGYVIYEKTISKGEAKDWLELNNNHIQKEETSVNADKDKQNNANNNETDKTKREFEKDSSNHIDSDKANHKSKKTSHPNIEPELTKLQAKKASRNRKKQTVVNL